MLLTLFGCRIRHRIFPVHGGYSCGGQLFGFSGLDGQTKEDSGFVAVQTVPIGSLSFCAMAGSPTLVVHSAAVLSAADVTVATNDVMVARSTGAALTMAWHSGQLLLGGSSTTISVELAAGTALADAPTGLTCSWVSNLVLCLAKPASGQVSWGLGYAANASASAAGAAAMSMAATVRSADAALTQTVEARLAPLLLTPTVEPKYQKVGPRSNLSPITIFRLAGLCVQYERVLLSRKLYVRLGREDIRSAIYSFGDVLVWGHGCVVGVYRVHGAEKTRPRLHPAFRSSSTRQRA